MSTMWHIAVYRYPAQCPRLNNETGIVAYLMVLPRHDVSYKYGIPSYLSSTRHYENHELKFAMIYILPRG